MYFDSVISEWKK